MDLAEGRSYDMCGYLVEAVTLPWLAVLPSFAAYLGWESLWTVRRHPMCDEIFDIC